MAIIAGQVQTLPYQYGDSSAMIQSAQNLAMAGSQGIADLTGQVKDYFKQQGDAKKSAQLGIKIAEAAKIMDPNQAPYYDNLIFSMKDENTPVQVRGALGASVQDLLKQNVSSRAVAVQEAQMGMRPAYFGGGQAATRPTYGTSAISQAARASRGVDMSQGDAALAGQPNQDMIPPGSGATVVQGSPPGASVNLDAGNLNSMIQQLAKLRPVSPEENKQYVTNFADAVVAQNEQGATQVLSQITNELNKAREGHKVKEGQPAVTIQTPSGSFSAVRTVGGDYVNQETGEIIDSKTGSPKKFGGVRLLSQDDLNKAQEIYDASMGGEVLPPLLDNFDPQSSIGTPAERARVQGMVAENQGRAMVQNIPQGAMPTDQSLAYGNVEPQSAQIRISESSAPVDTSSFARSVRTVAQSAQAPKTDLIKQYNDITQLNPYQQELVNEAKIEASQSGASPNKAVSTELERNILFNRAFVPTSLPKQGVRIVTPEDKKRQSNALLAQAKTRTVDRVMAYELMNRFDTIQQILNHPQANEFFGQSLPEEEIKKLARDQGGIYALYANLKGQDLVGALADIKEKSGTAAGMAASETKALQEAANPLNSTQDWNSAKKTLMQLSSDTIRSGKKLGLTGVFSYADPNDKSKGFKAQELLRSTNEFDPIFEDEVEYYNKVDKLKSQIEGVPQQRATPQQTGQIQQAQPSFDAYGNAYQNILKKYNLPPR
jgi:hypothetical protein